MENSYSNDAVVGNIQAVTAIFPETPVQVGDSWEVHTQVNSGFAMDVHSTFTLEAAEKDHYVLSGSSELKSVASGEYQVINGMEMQTSMEGGSKTSIKLEKESGWVRDSKISQKLH